LRGDRPARPRDDPRFATADLRLEHVGECVVLLDAVFAEREAKDWTELLGGQEGQWALVQTNRGDSG